MAEDLTKDIPLRTVELTSVIAEADVDVNSEELQEDIKMIENNSDLTFMNEVAGLLRMHAQHSNINVEQQGDDYYKATVAQKLISSALKKSSPKEAVEEYKTQLEGMFKVVNIQEEVIDAIVNSIIRIEESGIVLKKSRVIEKLEKFLLGFQRSQVSKPWNYDSLKKFLITLKQDSVQNLSLLNVLSK